MPPDTLTLRKAKVCKNYLYKQKKRKNIKKEKIKKEKITKSKLTVSHLETEKPLEIERAPTERPFLDAPLHRG